MSRLAVPKTYKLYIGGKFPRSESGRTYEVVSAKGAFLANAAKASRKDARDAVVAARAALGGWAGATAYNRGQVLYRIAELLEGRRAQFVDEIVQAEGVDARRSRAHRSTRRSTAGSGTRAGPTSTRRSRATRIPSPDRTSTSRCPSRPASSPIVAPQGSSLLGFVSVVAPALVAGNTVVVVASERFPLSAISLSEVLATSDVPGGVVNILTGSPAEIAPWLASHADVNALDLVGAGDLDWVDLQIAAADTLKRVLPPENGPDAAAPSLDRIIAFTETKTVWHTKSMI